MRIPKKLRIETSKQHTALRNYDGTQTHHTQEAMGRWAEWITQQSQLHPEEETTASMHIANETWQKDKPETHNRSPPEQNSQA